MRTLILSLLLFAGIQSQAQEDIYSFELNIGLCETTDDYFPYSPGMSYLAGITRITRSNKVFEAQVGLAAPFPITGRIGTGIYIEEAKTTITVGVRPLPAHAYVQLQWLPLNKSYGFTLSYEESAFSLLKTEPNYSIERSLFDVEVLSGQSFRIFTVGYKWNIGSKFGRR